MRPIFGEKPLWFQCILLAALLLFFFALAAALILSMPASAYQGQALVTSLVCALLPSLTYGWLVYREPLRETGFQPSSNGWYYFLAALIVLVAIPMTQVLASWNEGLHLPHSMAAADKWIHDTENSQDGSIKQLLDMPGPAYLIRDLFTMALVVAIGEEALFRGVVQKILVSATRNVHVGVWLGAIFFSAMHFQFLGFFPRVVLGLVLGYLYVYSGSLWPSIVAHFVYNGSQVVYFYIQQHQVAAHPNPVFDDNATMPLSYGLLSTALVLAGFVWMRRLKPTPWPST